MPAAYNFSAQWQTLQNVVWLQRVGKVNKQLLAVPNIPLEPVVPRVVGEPRHFVENIVPTRPHLGQGWKPKPFQDYLNGSLI